MSKLKAYLAYKLRPKHDARPALISGSVLLLGILLLLAAFTVIESVLVFFGGISLIGVAGASFIIDLNSAFDGYRTDSPSTWLLDIWEEYTEWEE